MEEPISHHFVTAMIKGDTGAPPGHWAIKGADAQAGDLKVADTSTALLAWAVCMD